MSGVLCIAILSSDGHIIYSCRYVYTADDVITERRQLMILLCTMHCVDYCSVITRGSDVYLVCYCSPLLTLDSVVAVSCIVNDIVLSILVQSTFSVRCAQEQLQNLHEYEYLIINDCRMLLKNAKPLSSRTVRDAAPSCCAAVLRHSCVVSNHKSCMLKRSQVVIIVITSYVDNKQGHTRTTILSRGVW